MKFSVVVLSFLAAMVIVVVMLLLVNISWFTAVPTPTHVLAAIESQQTAGATASSECNCTSVLPSTRAQKEVVLLGWSGVKGECVQKRLEAVVRGSGGRDVWVIMQGRRPDLSEIEYASQAGARVWLPHMHDLRLESMNEAWRTYGGGFGQIAYYILWYRQFGAQYDYFWCIESDVLFTGPWHVLFDAAHPSADLVAKTKKASKNWNHNRPEKCHIRNNKQCTSGGVVFWPLARVSSRFATFISEELDSGKYRGHGEAIGHELCAAMSCKIEPLPFVALHELGTFLHAQEPRASSLGCLRKRTDKPLHNHVYHPVKCGSEPESGAWSLQWLEGELGVGKLDPELNMEDCPRYTLPKNGDVWSIYLRKFLRTEQNRLKELQAQRKAIGKEVYKTKTKIVELEKSVSMYS